ncbi:PREDICTED: histidine--tRNA ligase, chloroplastic/mitochondrial isoform X2 [Camelina sativa]|uniref:histidine--tRNA ligase n=1 Tax=Camelina sativa TaxID=90675 RepID=A0ABM0ZF98_CAMSA|nr:PREDICTED: histidine--tRNA ligase, chloroplastic/mitochondrial isoform X2 [Camelina sativa]
MRGAIHMIVTTRLSSSLRPILLDFVSICSPPRNFSIPRRLICAAATKANGGGGGRSGSIVAPPLLTQDEDFQKIDVNPPKGTRDFPPEDMRLRNWLFNHFKEVSRLFGYEEVDFPVLETEALFLRKAGEEIRDQLYCFEDRGNRRVALRPELTPSLARLVIQKGKSVSLPLKWFAVGQCWRYERMTRGRRREHYQWNMDIIGVPQVTAEAELISSIVTFFKRIGITASDVGFKVSSRKVLQELLTKYGVTEDMFGRVCIIIDKIEKIPIDEIKKELGFTGISEDAIEQLLQVLSVKSLDDLEDILGGAGEAIADLKQLFSLAEKFGYSEWIQFDASVVRGLAYYTGIVFEGFDRKGKLRAICGGGRYDRLLSTYGVAQGEGFVTRTGTRSREHCMCFGQRSPRSCSHRCNCSQRQRPNG